jgi:hypothetical protein
VEEGGLRVGGQPLKEQKMSVDLKAKHKAEVRSI